jgi:hypothetical protein
MTGSILMINAPCFTPIVEVSWNAVGRTIIEKTINGGENTSSAYCALRGFDRAPTGDRCGSLASYEAASE